MLANLSTQGMPDSMRKAMKVRGPDGVGWPYPRQAYLATEYQLRSIPAITLENERLRVVVAPNLGPRILEAHDKRLGVPMILPVDAINTILFAVAGALVVGGIEFNPFRLGHSVFNGQPLPVDEVRFRDGSTGIRIGGLDELVNMSFTVLIRLFSDTLAWQVTVENHLKQSQPLYWYTNITIPASEDTWLMYEPGTPLLNHGLDPGFHAGRWPTIYGRSAARWGEHTNRFLSCYFHRYRSRFMGFCDPALDAAVAHCAGTDVLRGRKLWSMGARDVGPSWFDRMNETGLDNYCEIQAGIPPVQLLYGRIGSREVLRWTESIFAFPFRSSGDYGRIWSDFEKQARARERAARPDAAEAWSVVSARTVIHPSPRQRTAWDALTVLRDPKPGIVARLTDDAVLSSGWRGGAGWAAVLKEAMASGNSGGWIKLHSAAAQIVLGDSAGALRTLPVRPDGPSMLRAQTWRLRGAVLRKVGRLREACQAAEAAVRSAPQEPMLWKEVLEYRRAIQDAKARRRLVARCPASAARHDIVRFELARLHFDLHQFAAAIRVLSKPMLDITEANLEPWLLWRECWVAIGLRAWQNGQSSAACRAFMNACGLAAQFGVGRRESDANEMPFYYRWRLASELGDRVAADTLAARLMRRWPHPAGENALYLLRLATETGHPSAPRRRALIERWWRGERRLGRSIPVWASALLDTITRGQPSRHWRRIGATELIKYRAAFELGMHEFENQD